MAIPNTYLTFEINPAITRGYVSAITNDLRYDIYTSVHEGPKLVEYLRLEQVDKRDYTAFDVRYVDGTRFAVMGNNIHGLAKMHPHLTIMQRWALKLYMRYDAFPGWHGVELFEVPWSAYRSDMVRLQQAGGESYRVVKAWVLANVVRNHKFHDPLWLALQDSVARKFRLESELAFERSALGRLARYVRAVCARWFAFY